MYVYLIKPEGKKSREVKIGKANSIEARLKQLQTGHPAKLEVYDYIPCKSEANAFFIENCIHKEFSDLRLSGEWYKLTTNLGNYVLGLKTGDLSRQERALEKHKLQVEKGHFKRL